MLTLLHGENTSASRARFQELQDQAGGMIAVIDLATQSGSDPLAILQTTGLFTEKQFAAIENAVATKTIDQVAKYALSDAVFWEGKKLTPTQISSFQKLFPESVVQEFKIDPVVFKFVESVRPGNTKQMISLLHSYLKTDPPELVFTMLVRQFRFLLLAATNSSDGPDDWQRVSWQKAKLVAQAKTFSLSSLEENFRRLNDIDYRNKTGQLTEGTLREALELFLLTL